MINGYKRTIVLAAAAIVVGSAAAAEPAGTAVKREIIPGSELMTPEERERYRQRMRSAPSPEAGQRVREEHVRQMRERARLRGLRLPEEQDAKGGSR